MEDIFFCGKHCSKLVLFWIDFLFANHSILQYTPSLQNGCYFYPFLVIYVSSLSVRPYLKILSNSIWCSSTWKFRVVLVRSWGCLTLTMMVGIAVRGLIYQTCGAGFKSQPRHKEWHHALVIRREIWTEPAELARS